MWVIQVPKDEPVRRKARLFLEMALLPPGYLLPPQSAARLIEEAMHKHFHEEELASGKLYLRRLKAIMDLMLPGSPKYQPAIREIIAAGV